MLKLAAILLASINKPYIPQDYPSYENALGFHLVQKQYHESQFMPY
jgi:hypothetical protein